MAAAITDILEKISALNESYAKRFEDKNPDEPYQLADDLMPSTNEVLVLLNETSFDSLKKSELEIITNFLDLINQLCNYENQYIIDGKLKVDAEHRERIDNILKETTTLLNQINSEQQVVFARQSSTSTSALGGEQPPLYAREVVPDAKFFASLERRLASRVYTIQMRGTVLGEAYISRGDKPSGIEPGNRIYSRCKILFSSARCSAEKPRVAYFKSGSSCDRFY